MTDMFFLIVDALPSWLKLVRTSAAPSDGFEGLAEFVGVCLLTDTTAAEKLWTVMPITVVLQQINQQLQDIA